MDWLVLFSLVATLLFFCAAAGYMLLSILNFTGTRAILLSPAVGVGIIALSTYVGVLFNDWSLLYPTILFACITAIFIFRKTRRKLSPPPKINWFYLGFSGLGLLVFALVYLPPVINQMGYAAAPQSWGDAGFHLQGIRAVFEYKNVNPIGALGVVQDPITPKTEYFYSTLWHGTASLMLPLVEPTLASNVLTFFSSAILWPLSLSAVAYSISPRLKTSGFWTALFATFIVAFPSTTMFANSINAFGLSVPLTLFAIAAIIMWSTEHRWTIVVALLFIALAVFSTKPSSAVLLGACVLVLCAVLLTRQQLTWMTERRFVPVILTVGSEFILLYAFYRMVPHVNRIFVEKFGNIQHGWVSYRDALRNVVVGNEASSGFIPVYFAWILIMVIALIGIVSSIRNLAGQVASAITLGFLILYLIASGPERPLKVLTTPWGKYGDRIVVFLLALMVVFAAIALARFAAMLTSQLTPIHRFLPITICTAVAAAIVATQWLQGGVVRETFTDRAVWGYSRTGEVENMLTEERIEMLSSVDDFFPEGTRVVGVPNTGAEFTASVSRSHPMFPLHPLRTKDLRYLAANFNNITSDPEICRLLEAAGAEVLITTSAPPRDIDFEPYAGVRTVDPSEGFELLREHGNLKLWRITACTD